MIHILAQQPVGKPPSQYQAEVKIPEPAPQPVLSGLEQMPLLAISLVLCLVAILLVGFVLWLSNKLNAINKLLGMVDESKLPQQLTISQQLTILLGRIGPSKTPTQGSGGQDDALIKFKEATDAARKLTETFGAIEKRLTETKASLDRAASIVASQEAAMANERAELVDLRRIKPELEFKVSELESRLRISERDLNEAKAALEGLQIKLHDERAVYDEARSGLLADLAGRTEELSVAKQDFIRLTAEFEAVRADLATTQSRRDELSSEADRLDARNVELESGLSASRADRESFIDWVLTREVREMFAEELGGILASKTDHEVLSSLAMLKDAGSDLSDESVVLANIRHLGELLVRFYKSQGLDAAQRDPKLRKWADFVNAKASGRAQVVVPGLKFPVNAAVMVAPDGVKVISDVLCWQVNNVKGVVYAPAKVS